MSFSSVTRVCAASVTQVCTASRVTQACATLLFAALMSLSAGPAAAQQDAAGTVTGTVVEQSTGDPVPSATVALLAVPDSSLVTGAITNDDGSFRLEGIQNGSYVVRISFVGYESRVVSDVVISSSDPTAALGDVALAESTTELEGVDVSAERLYMQEEIDRTVYNVENQPITSGGSATDALDQLPSVTIDFDGNISLRGNENVVIYLNGQPSPMTGESLVGFLNSLPADAIDRIEVIPNPSAAFEPEGMAGIINIVLAKDQDLGLGGGVSASANSQNEYRGSGNIRYGDGPWNLYVNGGVRYGRRESSGSEFRRYFGTFPTLPPAVAQDEVSDHGGLSQYANTTIDYSLNDMSTISASGRVRRSNRDGEERRLYDELNEDDELIGQYHRITDGENRETGVDARLSFNRIVEPRVNELDVEASFDYETENDIERFIQQRGEIGGDGEIVERQNVDEHEKEMELEMEANYKRPLGKGLNLEAGYEGEWEREDNELFSETFDTVTGEFEPDNNLSNTFKFDEMTHGVFGLLSGEMGKFGAKAGGRIERASTSLDVAAADSVFENYYFSYFPSVHFSYKPVTSHLLRASYSKRVDRPNTWQLNPIADFDDPTSRRIGNPELEPEYTHSFELGYTNLGNNYTLSLTPYYRYTVNAITWDERLTEEGVSITTYENFATRSSSGVEMTASVNPFDWLDVNGSFNAFQRVTDGSNVRTDLGSNAWGFRARLSGTAEIRSGLSLQFQQYYRSPIDVPNGHMESFNSTSIALRQTFWNERASVSLSARDVFDTMNFEMWRETDEFRQESLHDWGAQSIRLSLRYTFGKQDERPPQQQPEGGNDAPEGGGMGF